MLRYEAMKAMSLNEFLKEHRKSKQQEPPIEDLEATVAKQQRDFQKEIQTLSASLKDEATLIRKVSDRLEASKPALQVVADNR
jgi:hypothetical protein